MAKVRGRHYRKQKTGNTTGSNQNAAQRSRPQGPREVLVQKEASTAEQIENRQKMLDRAKREQAFVLSGSISSHRKKILSYKADMTTDELLDRFLAANPKTN